MPRKRTLSVDINLAEDQVPSAAKNRILKGPYRWFFNRRKNQKSWKEASVPQKIRYLAVRGLWLILGAHIVFVLSTALILFVFKTINPPATTLMAYRKLVDHWNVRPIRYLPLQRIPRTYRSMIVRVEDGDFYQHHGILLPAIKNAWILNQQFGSPVYGGSTITMQTARTIFLIPFKSYLRKYLEVLIALEMEAILGKNRILELYCNYAEWGKGIFGIDTASRYYYKTSVTAIDRDQAARLITLLSSPIKYNPDTIYKNGILRSRYEYLTRIGQ